MTCFIVYYKISTALSCLYLFYSIYVFAESKIKSDHLHPIDQESLASLAMINFISSKVLVVWMIYSTICLNSLYLKIKDEELAIAEMKEISTNHENPCENPCDLKSESNSYDEAICNK